MLRMYIFNILLTLISIVIAHLWLVYSAYSMERREKRSGGTVYSHIYARAGDTIEIDRGPVRRVRNSHVNQTPIGSKGRSWDDAI